MEKITPTSATKLTPQATQQKRMDPISSSKYCQRTQDIQEHQRSTSTFRKFKSIKMKVPTDPFKSKQFNQFHEILDTTKRRKLYSSPSA